MTTAAEVIRYIRSQTPVYGEMHAHKLLYYVQAWSVTWDGEPLFDDVIEAWDQGPVVPTIRRNGAWQADGDSDINLSQQQKLNILSVIEHYGSMGGGGALSKLTHEESPWKLTWGDKPKGSCGNDPIALDLMRREYTLQSLQGKGPRRHTTAAGSSPGKWCNGW